MPGALPAPQLLGRWLLEATGLVALYLLVRERGLGRWLAGLASGWTAWIFRGPVLVLTVANASRLSASAWWNLSAAWFGLYTVCGLVMASVARSLEGREEPIEPERPEAAATAQTVEGAEVAEEREPSGGSSGESESAP
jgi:hypothetical protein